MKRKKVRPQSVSIGGKVISIQQVEMEDYGSFNPNDLTIKIKSNLSDEMFFSTLNHEISHCGFFLSGLSELLDEKMEEAIVLMLENIVFPHVK